MICIDICIENIRNYCSWSEGNEKAEMSFAIRAANFFSRQPAFPIIVVMLFCVFSLIRLPRDLVHPINHFNIAYVSFIYWIMFFFPVFFFPLTGFSIQWRKLSENKIEVGILPNLDFLKCIHKISKCSIKTLQNSLFFWFQMPIFFSLID